MCGCVRQVTSSQGGLSYAGRMDQPAWQHPTYRRPGPAARALASIVVVWWLLLGVVVVRLMPEPTASAQSKGHIARIHQVGLRQLPIPASRAGFDAFQRGIRESDEASIEDAFAISEWIYVTPGQEVRTVTIDGDAVEIEVLDGPYAGRRAWLDTKNVRPLH
jgi:hypothetical protein